MKFDNSVIYLNSKEAAKECGVSLLTLDSWGVPCFKHKGRRYYHPDDINQVKGKRRKSQKALTNEDREKIGGDFNKGMTYRDICKKHDVSMETVYQIAKERKTKARVKRYTKDEKEEMKKELERRMFNESFPHQLSLPEAAHSLGISKSFAQKLLGYTE